jgi:uncharacterized oxidoreductase
MKLSGNTILITGGGSGIGRGLAEALQREGNQIVIAGRRKKMLEETVAANPEMQSAVLDIQNADDVRRFAKEITVRFPSLNVLINNAGIMRAEKLLDEPNELADLEAIVWGVCGRQP